MAPFRYSLSEYPLRNTTWHPGQKERMASAASSPVFRGIFTSLMRMSGRQALACSTVSSPSEASTISVTPSSAQGRCSLSTIRGIVSSSAIKTVSPMRRPPCVSL